jgi:hypothetical protein
MTLVLGIGLILAGVAVAFLQIQILRSNKATEILAGNLNSLIQSTIEIAEELNKVSAKERI